MRWPRGFGREEEAVVTDESSGSLGLQSHCSGASGGSVRLSTSPWFDSASCTSSESASRLSGHPRPSDPEGNTGSVSWDSITQIKRPNTRSNTMQNVFKPFKTLENTSNYLHYETPQLLV